MYFKISIHLLQGHFTLKTFQLVILCLICVAKSYGQLYTKNTYGRIDAEITKEKKPKKIYAKVKIISAFPSGDSVWVQSLEKRINESLKFRNGAKKGKYIVSVIFIVDVEGNISDVRCVNDPVGFGMEEQVLRAIKKKSKWLPSSQGVPVKPYRTSSSTPPGE